MTPSEAMRVMENPSDYTVQERKDAKKVIAGVGSLGQDTTSPMRGKMPLPKSKPKKKKMAKGGMSTKEVPVVTIGIGTAKVKEGNKSKKTEMAYGGMSKGKKHNYAAGGMVKDSPGLKALKAASPEAYKKITGK